MTIFTKTVLNSTKTAVITTGIPPIVRFWTYLIFDICSVLCSLFVLYYFLSIRKLRRARYNHIIIVLLCTGLLKELISVPWTLYRLQVGVPIGHTRSFYLASFFFDYALFTTQVILVAWMTLEKHILIFHAQWLTPKWKCYLLHYLPITTLLVYCLIYYSVVTFDTFCETSFTAYLAGGYMIPCAYNQTGLAMWELLVHQLIPTLIIAVFSIAIIVRVVKWKRLLNQPFIWRRQRRMIIHMISISSLYLILNSPWTVTVFAIYFGMSQTNKDIYTIHGLYFQNFIIFFYPFVCFRSSRIFRKKFKEKLTFCRR